MSKTLHALWLPRALSGEGGVLALWGESSHPHRRAHSPYDHPLALNTSAIDYALVSLRLYRATHYHYRDKPHTLTLALPSDSRRPLASASLAPQNPQRLKRRNSSVTLRPWRAEACFLPAAQAFAFLMHLPTDHSLLSSLKFGPSLRYWEQVAHLTAAALMRGQFVPSANEAGQGRWQMALIEADLQTAAAQLARAMPPSARALAQPMPIPQELVDDFIATVGSAFVAEAYTPGRSPFYNPYDYRNRPAQPRPADRWWMGLFPRKSYYFYDSGKTDPDAQAEFGERVRDWALPVQHYLTSPQRVAFRLEPPATIVETIDPDHADWHLSLHLQPKDQPETLWAANEIWENPPDPAMPDVLRAGLAQAAGFYPALAGIEDETFPTGLWLNVAEAFEFLERYSVELNGRGFGVLVPTWWTLRERSRKLNARLSLQWNEGSGLFGMDALVNFNWELAIGDKALTPDEFVKLAQSKTALVQVRGEWMQLNPEEVQAALKLVQRHQKSKGKLALREALGLALTGPTEWDGLDIEDVQVDGWLDEMTRRLKGHHTLEHVPQPASFVGQLRPYQCNGLSWLNFMRQYGLGACLADDMGLGKTIQVLALLQKDLEENRLTKPTLLVCPTTVVNNWVREAARFTPQLRCYAHHGPGRFKGSDFAKAAAEHHLVITSYALLPRDFEFLNNVEWAGAVLDEAHNIKNPTTKAAQSARQLAAHYRVALTGTPVENRLQDLWSIMHFLNPGYLGSAESFQQHYAGPIERSQDEQATRRLRSLTGPFILRRLKTDSTIIQDLPLKNEMKEYCGLTKEQAALYKAVVNESLRQIAAADGIQRRGIILATLTKLKQACNHPRHLLGDQSALKHRSGKLNRLTEMLEQALAEEDRCLIFTQYAEMGQLLHDYLTEAFGETLYLYGGTPTHKRAEMIDRFQDNGPRLFVLSLKAGGAGINLTRANRVFHYDRWWNPAVENQATDRAFRIGQTQAVQVHKMICRGTLEERVDELITRKVALADQIVGAGESWLTELSTDELRDLLWLRKEAVDE
jgi:SNF2 family DNA or RNA helicase